MEWINNTLASIKHTFLSFTDYDSCATRKEYWTFILFSFLLVFLLLKACFTFFPAETTISGGRTVHYVSIGSFGGILVMLFALLLTFPAIALTVRRLHDSGHSGFWFLVIFFPAIGILIFLIFMLLPTNKNSEYREDYFDNI